MPPCEQLSRTEVRVASLVWQGNTNPEIAVQFGTSEQVIKNHLRSIFDKLGVWSRLELALYVASHGGGGWGGIAETPPIENRLESMGVERGSPALKPTA